MPVLKNINLTLHQGEFAAIVGPSGSGKSTLLSIIGTLEEPTSGIVSFDKLEVQKLDQKKLADFRFNNIGFVFQQFHLLPTLTAKENVMVPLVSRKVDFDKNERAKELLSNLGLGDKLDLFPSQLSGGQQQRVAIARALINKPTWILADEPTGNLDSKTSFEIFNLLRSLNSEQNCGVIFVTHDLSLAQMSDKVIELSDGEILDEAIV
ncbi:ABC transporter ATP-binding protein [Bacillus sp. T33-2]|uniref:ABC transporter ATP-binding protein n=1 Tax=Bacillus sp. T33-2 TaxID=2054168 RepID=UPI0027E3FEC6|nr:ABC transporter ATP-binding protein [Bacillus sp. T33-2]